MTIRERLYLDDPLRLSFDATVVAHASYQGRAAVVLDRTAFYPEAGGQLADQGSIDGRPVVDVQLDPEDRIVHLLDGDLPALPAVGAMVHGQVDPPRRRLHMALHTGQHILSRALLDVAGAHTVSSRLGATACTIDVRPGSVGPGERDRVEQLANEVIDEDLPVRCSFPTAEQLGTLPLRKPPKVHDDVRVVGIGDFDFVPCGGTHCVSTSQVGLVSITGIERYKKGQRITFVAGARARVELGRDARVLRELSRSMSCSTGELSAALAKQRRELTQTREGAARVERKLAAYLAEELAADRDEHGRVIAVVDVASLTLLRAVAFRIVERAAAVALLASAADDGLHVVVARHEAASFDCGSFLKRAAAACGGRGGGREDHGEGRLPAHVDWLALARDLASPAT